VNVPILQIFFIGFNKVLVEEERENNIILGMWLILDIFMLSVTIPSTSFGWVNEVILNKV
jgi:hypothetical protein